MKEQKESKSFNLLINDLSNVVSSNSNSSMEYLKEKGITEKSVNEGVLKIKKLQAKINREKAKKRNAIFQKAKKIVSRKKIEVDDAITSLFSNKKLQPFFRKIESLDEEDAKQMLEDFEILQELEKLIEDEG